MSKSVKEPITPALLTREQAAEYLNVLISTVWRLRDDGLLPYVKFRNLVRYRREDLDACAERLLHERA